MAKGALQDALFHSCDDDFLPRRGFLMFVSIESSICHEYMLMALALKRSSSTGQKSNIQKLRPHLRATWILSLCSVTFNTIGHLQ